MSLRPEHNGPPADGEFEPDPSRVVIRDKRRVDPTGHRRPDSGGPAASPTPATTVVGAATPGPAAGPAAEAAPAEAAALQATLAERTADLQRVQAEYANYRRRVDRDRQAVVEQATAAVLAALLPVLDDIGRARAHGELEGGFRSVAETLESTLSKLGLERYGEPGDPFDPTVHEAITHGYSPDVDQVTCVDVLQPGYRAGGRVLRPALVAVAEPGEPEQISEDDS